MSDWQTQFDAMRKQFQERARHRLKRTAELLQSLENGAQNDQALPSLLKDMHWLTGVGGTYKLAELTTIGEAGEQVCDRCLADGKTLTADDLTSLRALVAQAVAALSAPI